MSLSEEKLDEIVAREREHEYEPLNDWRTIAARAREEGLIRESAFNRWSAIQPLMQAAAAVLLLIGGIAIGRVSRATTSPASASYASVDEASAALDRSLNEYQRASAFLAANNPSGAVTRDSSSIYSARLAALNKVGNAMESALETAPNDPVINQYYLAAMGARVATQQLVSRPVGLRGF